MSSRCRHKWEYVSLLKMVCSKCLAAKTREVGGKWYYWSSADPYTWYYKRKAT